MLVLEVVLCLGGKESDSLVCSDTVAGVSSNGDCTGLFECLPLQPGFPGMCLSCRHLRLCQYLHNNASHLLFLVSQIVKYGTNLDVITASAIVS